MVLKKDLSGNVEVTILSKLGTIRREDLDSGMTLLQIMETILVHKDGTLEECVATAPDSSKAAIVLVAKISANQRAGGYVINERNKSVVLVNDMWSMMDRVKRGA